MKKNALRKITASLFIISTLAFTGCQQAIYEAIREDVEPEKATVSGNIGAITRYTAGGNEYLVLAANEGLKYKQKDKNSHGEWKGYGIPFELHHYDFNSSSHAGQQILSVLADSTYLYIISASYGHTSIEGSSYPSSINLYAKSISANGTDWSSAGSWASVPTRIGDIQLFPIYVDSDEVFHSDFRVFQTNAPKKEHRAAFVRTYDYTNKVYKYFRLNGADTPADVTTDVEAAIIDPNPSSAANYKATALSAVWFGGAIKYFTTPAATTNETYTDEASYYYYSNGDTRLLYSNGGAPVEALNTDAVISALATTADSILIGHGKANGAEGGISRVLHTNGVPANSKANFETNAEFQITKAYMVMALVNASPEKTEKESGLYAAITFSGSADNFDNIGLWSYYPGRGNWNRE